jgi:hypothetical protein
VQEEEEEGQEEEVHAEEEQEDMEEEEEDIHRRSSASLQYPPASRVNSASSPCSLLTRTAVSLDSCAMSSFDCGVPIAKPSMVCVSAPGRRIIENDISNGDRSMTYLENNCSYRRAETVRGGRLTYEYLRSPNFGLSSIYRRSDVGRDVGLNIPPPGRNANTFPL